MRIDLTQSVASQISNEPNTKQVGAKNTAASSLADGEDRTTLTSVSAYVSSLVNTAMTSPEIRQDKVDGLKQAIGSGNYDLNPARIAESMIDEQA